MIITIVISMIIINIIVAEMIIMIKIIMIFMINFIKYYVCITYVHPLCIVHIRLELERSIESL